MDDQKFHNVLDRFVRDLGPAIAAGGLVLGDQLGLYAAMADGPQSADVLAVSTGTAARYVVHDVPPCRRDTVQPGLRGAAMRQATRVRGVVRLPSADLRGLPR